MDFTTKDMSCSSMIADLELLDACGDRLVDDSETLRTSSGSRHNTLEFPERTALHKPRDWLWNISSPSIELLSTCDFFRHGVQTCTFASNTRKLPGVL